MTPQEALAQALDKHRESMGEYHDCFHADTCAAAILDALPEGWSLVGLNTYHDSAFQVGIRFGAQQERDRLDPLLVAADRLATTAHDYDCGDECDRCQSLREAVMAFEYESQALADPEDDRVTPQEALARALHAAAHAPYCECRAIEVDRERAAAILDALREQGWCVTTMTGQLALAENQGAQQERERLRKAAFRPYGEGNPDGAWGQCMVCGEDGTTLEDIDVFFADPEDDR